MSKPLPPGEELVVTFFRAYDFRGPRRIRLLGRARDGRVILLDLRYPRAKEVREGDRYRCVITYSKENFYAVVPVEKLCITMECDIVYDSDGYPVIRLPEEMDWEHVGKVRVSVYWE